MNPGATTSPWRRSRVAAAASPSLADRRDAVADDADVGANHGAPVPSTTRPPAITTSKGRIAADAQEPADEQAAEQASNAPSQLRNQPVAVGPGESTGLNDPTSERQVARAD